MGTNLNDECYVQMLLDGLTTKEKAELIKEQVTRMQASVHAVGEKVLVRWENSYHLAVVTGTHSSGTVDVHYCEPYEDDHEISVIPERVRSLVKPLAKARQWELSGERIGRRSPHMWRRILALNPIT